MGPRTEGMALDARARMLHWHYCHGRHGAQIIRIVAGTGQRDQELSGDVREWARSSLIRTLSAQPRGDFTTWSRLTFTSLISNVTSGV